MSGLVGLETEMFLLNRKGQVVNQADSILQEIKNKHIMKECATSMIEVAAPPSEAIHVTTRTMFKNMEATLEIAEKKELSLLPLGTYPGKNMPEMRKNGTYGVKEKLFGKQRFLIGGRCAGFHCHYDLPFNLPLIKNLSLLQFLDIKHESALINGYNMMIAMDPALTTFMQSSPFYQGQHLAKDSRMVVYRGSESLQYPKALYAQYPNFGNLPGYKHSMFEVLDMVKEKFNDWKNCILSVGVNIKTLSLYGSLLSTSWNPVKINPIGTLEQRGMDMNHPQNIVAAAALIKYTTKRIYEDELDVIPGEIGIAEPFKVEGDRLYVPPEKYVYKDLQKASAYQGLDSKKVYAHCEGLLKFAKDSIPNEGSVKYLLPFEKMLEEKRTVSDEILKEAKKHGWIKTNQLSQKAAQNISLKHANRLFKEIVLAKRQLEKLGDGE
jgi:gamma-glutamylcysteine synthetase